MRVSLEMTRLRSLVGLLSLSLMTGLAAPSEVSATDAERLLLRCNFDVIVQEPSPSTVRTTECINNLPDKPNPPQDNIKLATVHGGATAADGRFGSSSSDKAIEFDGTDDYISIPGMPILDGNEGFTVEAWVYKDGYSGNIFRVQQPVALHGNYFQVANYATGGGWESVHIPGGAAPPSQTWYHVAGVFDQREMRIYLDGRLADTLIVDFETLAGASSYTDWSFGARLLPPGAIQFFEGRIDELAVYDVPLEAGMIWRHAQDRPVVAGAVIDVTTHTQAALGDGVTDDGPALQDALDDAAVTGAEVYIPRGIYLVGATLDLPSGVLVRGDGDTILKPTVAAGAAASPIFLGTDIADSTIRDLQIWGRSYETENQLSGFSAIQLLGTERVHIDRVRVSNLGRNRASYRGNFQYGGINILLDDIDDSPGDEGSSVGNVIENCTLDDWDHLASFGIRLTTKWKDLHINPMHSETVRKNIIKNNRLEGFFQGIEIAGPQTKENLIRGNQSLRPLIVGIEADKGARDNLYLDNYVRLGRYWIPSSTSGMRDQGYLQCVDQEPVHEFNSSGNVFRRNTIADMTDRKIAAGILLARTENGEFSGNMVRDIRSTVPMQAAMVAKRDGQVGVYDIHDNLYPTNLAREITLVTPLDECP